MSSGLAWLDNSDAERQKVLEVVELFKERDTRDELGLGSIRDSIAEQLSPGTSTIQTRARYFLFIPWIYQRIERQGRRAKSVAARARDAEIQLIEPLSASEDPSGTIGRLAGSGLRTLPSAVYWSGLAAWGIRLFPGSREQYHQWIELGGPASINVSALVEDPETPMDQVAGAWHPGLPEPPDDFPESVSFELTETESDYVAERIRFRGQGTLLDFLLTEGEAWDWVAFPWEHPQFAQFPPALRELLEHGRCFSEVLNGGALTYNLMLAELVDNAQLVDQYRTRLAEWAEMIGERESVLEAWDRARFWAIAHAGGTHVTPQTEHYVDRWLDLVIGGDAGAVPDLAEARALISERERRLKGGQARLHNRRALELWGGGAGTARLNYRWGITQQHALDILAGRSKDGADA